MQYKILSQTPSFTLEVYPKPAFKPAAHPEITPDKGKGIKDIFGITSEARLKGALDAVLASLNMSSTPGVTEDDQEVLDQDSRWQAVVWQIHEKGMADKLLTIVMRPVSVVEPEPLTSLNMVPLVSMTTAQLVIPDGVATSDLELVAFGSLEVPGEGLRKTAVVASQLLHGVSSVMVLGNGSLLVHKKDGHFEILEIASSQFSLKKSSVSEESHMMGLFPSVDGKTALGTINHGDTTDIIRYELTQTPPRHIKVVTVRNKVDSLIELPTAFIVLSAGKLMRVDKSTPDAVQTLEYADASIVDITQDPIQKKLYFSTDQGHLYSIGEGDQLTAKLIRKSDKHPMKMLRALDQHLFFSTEHDVFTASDTWVYQHQSDLNEFQVFHVPTLEGVVVLSGGNDVVMTHLVDHQRDILWKSPKPSDPKSQIPVSSIYAHGHEESLRFVVIRENKKTGTVQAELLQPGVSDRVWAPQLGQQVADTIRSATRHAAVRRAGETVSRVAEVTSTVAGIVFQGALGAVNYAFGAKPSTLPTSTSDN